MRDRCGLLRDYWYAAALASEVTTRQPIARTILGERLVLYRDGSRVVCLSDRCLHRNAPLSAGVILPGGCIACPYHGWTYDGAGQCVTIPSQSEGAPIDPSFRLRAWHAQEHAGLVWVWMGDDVPTREPFAMPGWAQPGWGAYYMVTPFSNGVTNLVENFMDVPHTVFVHRGWFRNPKRQPVRTLVERTADSVLVTYDQPADSIGFTGRILNPKNLPMVHTDKFYMPNVTRVDYTFGAERAFVITSTCTPRQLYDTLVYTLISFQLGNPLFLALGRMLLPWYTRRVIEQDVQIMKLQGESLAYHGTSRFRSSAADLLHEHIEALRGAAEQCVTEPLPPCSATIEMWI